MINGIIFIAMLCSIVFVHELGHFVMAKKFGVYCSEFAIGMGPKLWSRQKGETLYTIRALPIGGFCALAGEDGVDLPDEANGRTLQDISPMKKIGVLVMGSVMNFVYALFILLLLFSFSSQKSTNSNVLGGIVANSPASIAGMQSNDELISFQIDDEVYQIDYFSDLREIVVSDKEIYVTYLRDGVVKNTTIIPEFVAGEDRYILGVTAQTQRLGFGEAIAETGNAFKAYSGMIIGNIGKLLTGGVSARELSGPLGIYSATSASLSAGINVFATWVAVITINIGIFNLMPFPALDGGRIVMAIYEVITKKRVNQKIENGLNIVGFFILIGLMIFASYNDILRIFFK